MGFSEGPEVEEETLYAEWMMLETVEYVYQCWETTYWSRFAWRLLCLDITYGA